MEQAVEKPKASALPSGKLVEIYIELRDRRAKRKAAFDNEDADDKGKQEKIEGMLLQRFKADGCDSIKTPAGTAYTSSRVSATVADRETYFAWVLEAPDERMIFLESRANKTSVQTYKEENQDLPPGITWTETTTINVRRS